MTRFFADTQFRIFANNARIAVMGCTGIPISAQHYNELKDMTLNFSPQGRIN
jgi:predicted ATP-grasp superfamily ATP-dependent carboligase